MSEPTSFNLEHVYDDEINPLMAKIIDICKVNGLPFVASFCFAADEETGEEDYCTSCMTRGPDDWLPVKLEAMRREAVRKGTGLFAFTATTGEPR